MEQGRSYNRQTGKVADGETVSVGLVVAENRSNVRGAKEPCCNARPVAVGEAGANDKTPGKLQDPKSGGYTARGRWRRADQGGVGAGGLARIESIPDWRHPINFVVKRAGEPSAGNRHARFEVAGAGNRFTVRLVRHSQRKRGAQQIGQTFGTPRQSSTLRASSEGWHVQWEKKKSHRGKSQKPRSLNSRRERN
jgi:hypothetical protein